VIRFSAFGGAVLLLAVSVALGSGKAQASPVFLLVLAAALLVVVGALASTTILDEEAIIHQEKTRSEVLLAEAEQHRHAVDVLADGLALAIFVCESKAHVQYANRRAVEQFQFDHPLGRPILAVTLSYDLEQLVLKALTSGESQHAEITFTYPQERTGLVHVWVEGAPPVRAFVSIQDITDLRRLERVRQDFVANVSHELRTPLTTIRAMTETIQEEAGGEKLPEIVPRYLQKIIDEVDRLSLIANDLLVLSASESNPVRKQGCDLAEIIRACVSQLERKAKERGLELTFEGPDHLLIEANHTQMSQVVLNLLDNALNYTVRGSVVARLASAEENVVFEVRDTGLGIASEHLPRIFERFYRVDKGRSRSTGGTGLGLSIVKHIVEAHGGTVEVESELNEGSTFRVTLPKGE
jgi:two-component system phosphate regulon sensor histidine kinase PhoR